MKIGILGLAQTGKSTIFSLLTNTPYEAGFKIESDEKIAFVRDERVIQLVKMYKPEKTVFATLNFIDIPGFDLTAPRKEKNRILQMIQNVDALLLVIRAFENDQVLFPDGHETPLAQLSTLRTELIIRDMEVVENRLERMILTAKKKKPTPQEEREQLLLTEIKASLEAENFASAQGFSEDDKKILGSMALFTLKPIIVLINLDENQLKGQSYPQKEAIQAECQAQHFAALELSGKIESDLVEFSEEEKAEFLKEVGVTRPGIDRLSKLVYDHVGLISFFTVGADEVRAWTINTNTTMKSAAGKIHTDLEKGFVKAESMHYSDLYRLGSEEKVKQAGLWKLSGKDEIVDDGHILTIRANA
jgi:GTP-binding protein YchF